MGSLSERAAEEFVAARAFAPGLPGFVGITVDLPVEPGCAPVGRRSLRHGFLDIRSPRVMTVSGPPSPGIEMALRRMSDDLAASARIAEQHRLNVPGQATTSTEQSWLNVPGQTTTGAEQSWLNVPGQTTTGTDHRLGVPGEASAGVRPDGIGQAAWPATAGIRVGLEAGLDGGGPLGLPRRWALAHTLAPVLAAAFANSPLRHGRPTGWRSVRQAARRTLPVHPGGGDPRAAWTAYAMGACGSGGSSPRQTLRERGRITIADLERHLAGLRPPVAARGHLELDVADHQPGDGWRVVAAVTSILLDDPRAATVAAEATAHLAGEPTLWERAARDALTDPVLAAAARDCFLAAYAGLARQGVSRELRDTVADFTERYVYRGRCPADDVLDQATARP
ncbi:glutamate--cysteine ligase EgtA [Actinoplanes capillaceus]|uniref:glutamate--cysteine ligase n=1 Tax=Actinoplanes campanulatus TaxID=113559 RepID=A0ABQ3WKM6_9ACTN|nr:glutamate-cysteine ligase family protein [Actinoplanes capillaceus]GID46810.1 glutamate--cysteine ligase EgtA [Actinoplanes capillaceus]